MGSSRQREFQGITVELPGTTTWECRLGIRHRGYQAQALQGPPSTTQAGMGLRLGDTSYSTARQSQPPTFVPHGFAAGAPTPCSWVAG